MRWLVWTIFMVGWTIALEMPAKIHTGENSPFRYLIPKATHVVVYGCFAVLSAVVPLPMRFRFLMMFFLMAHANGTEFLQDLLEPYCHRTGSLADVGYDHIGIVIGVLVSWKWWTRPDVDDKRQPEIAQAEATESS